MTKTLLLAFLMLLSAAVGARAQIDTTGGRYHQPVFAQVTVTPAIAYGAALNVNGVNQVLRLDLYEPAGDALAQRPLIILAHEGAFFVGTRDDAFLVALATRLARTGYVVASIDYRLGFFPFDSANIGRASIRGSQDMRAAIRFFRRDAATARQYRIHPGYIYAGGSSAGAFAALQVGYLDKPAEVPAYVDLPAVGTLEGNSGNPGYSSRVAGVLNLSGAVGSLSWLEPGDAPLLSVHGTADATVPYLVGKAFGQATSPRLFGSGALKPRADAVGITNTLVPLRNAPHVPYNANTAYFDSTFQAVRLFLRPLLRRSATVLSAARPAGAQPAQVFPQPAEQAVTLEAAAGAPFVPIKVELTDATGRVLRRLTWTQPRLVIARGELPAGLYYLRGAGLAPQKVLFR